MSNARDHGLPASPLPVPGTVPRVVRINPEGHVVCPVCGCLTTCEIEVHLLVPQFASGEGWGRFTSCCACEYAGPCDVTESKPD